MTHWTARVVAILLGGLAWGCERAGELRSDTSRTGAHRLLPSKSVLLCAIGSCRCQSARAIRCRMVSGNYRNRPSETQTTSATIRAQTIPARGAEKRRSRASPRTLRRHCRPKAPRLRGLPDLQGRAGVRLDTVGIDLTRGKARLFDPRRQPDDAPVETRKID
jgi:hypothetical protein